MTETIEAKYKASIPCKSSIEIEHDALPLDLHKMIVWVIGMPEEALELLPEYERLRGEA